MSFPRYPAYKSSGVEWLGEVPEHWDVLQSRRMFKARREAAKEGAIMLTASQKYGMIPQAEFVEREGRRVVEVIQGKDNLIQVEPDDFVISMRSFQGGLEWCRFSGSTSFHYVPVTPLKHVIPCFFAHLLKSDKYISALRSTTNLIRDGQEIRYSNFVQVPLPIIPVSEQIAIATVLDHETAKIDALIAEQQRLIELLQEKRQAVISHAVTKGLNPDAPMKDSGVEWLGEVPEHWSVVPVKRLIEVKDGTHATPPYVDPSDDTFPLITSKDFVEDAISFVNAKHISGADHHEVFRRSNTEVGDLLMSMIGGNIGKALIVQADQQFSIKNVALFKTRENRTLAKYLLYYLQCGLLDVQIDLLGRGGAQGFLGLGDIRGLVFFKMPSNERLEIVEALDNQTAGFTQLLVEAKRAIELLQERRTALISATVTGQIDVRGMVDMPSAKG